MNWFAIILPVSHVEEMLYLGEGDVPLAQRCDVVDQGLGSSYLCRDNTVAV